MLVQLLSILQGVRQVGAGQEGPQRALSLLPQGVERVR